MKRIIGTALAFIMCIAPSFAQWQSPNHSVPIGRGPGTTGFSSIGPCSAGTPIVGGNSGISSDPICAPSLNALLPSITKTSDYTLSSSDQGSIYLQGNALFTLTVPSSSSGFVANAEYPIINNDAWGSGRGKLIHSPGGEFNDCLLYPTQRASLRRSSGNWNLDCPKRVSGPSGTLALYTNYNTSSGTYRYVDPATGPSGSAGGNNSNDGLDPSAPFQTIQQALAVLLDRIDFNGNNSGQTQIKIYPVCSTTDAIGIHYAPHSTMGANGGAAIQLIGCNDHSSVITKLGDSAIQVYQGLMMEASLISIQATTNDCVISQYGAHIYLNNVVLLGCSATGFRALDGGNIDLDGPIYISGNMQFLASVSGGNFHTSGNSITLNANTTMTAWVIATSGMVDFGNTTIYLNGYTFTGSQYTLSGSAQVTSPTGGFPGTAGSARTFASIDTGAPLSPGYMRSTGTADTGFIFNDLGCDGAQNLRINTSVSGNAFTISLINAKNGSDPSARLPIRLCFRDANPGWGDPVWIDVTAATNFTVAAGNTLGTTGGVKFTLDVIAIYDGSVVRVGLINPSDITQINPSQLHNTGAGTSGGNSSGVIYTSASSILGKAIRVIGTLTWNSGLSTPGIWDVGPDNVYVLGSDGLLQAYDSIATGTGRLVLSNSPAISNPTFTGSLTATGLIANAALANMVNATTKCRTTAGTGVPEDCTATQMASIIGAVGGTLVSKVISFTYDSSTASGTKAVTGVGFKPSSVIMMASVSSKSFSLSLTDANLTSYILTSVGDAAHGFNIGDGNAVQSYTDTTGSNAQYGPISSYDSDGFTLSLTKLGSPTGTITFLALCLR
jgi:hypothetical protein